MDIKIGTLNLCQGLQLKKNIVKETIIFNKIDILCLLETEVNPNVSTGLTVPSTPPKWIAKGLFYCNQNKTRSRAQYQDIDNWLIIGTIVTSSLQINQSTIPIVFYHVFAKRWVAG